MTIAFYDSFAHHLGLGDIDALNDDIRVALCDATYVYDTDHENIGDVIGIVEASVADLQAKTWTEDDAGSFLSADPITIPLVPAGHTVTQAILYVHGATTGESYLIGRMYGAAFPIITTGANVTITFVSSRVFSVNREGTVIVFTEAQLRDVASTLTDSLNVAFRASATVINPATGSLNCCPLENAFSHSVRLDISAQRTDAAGVARASYEILMKATGGAVAAIADADIVQVSESPIGAFSGLGGSQLIALAFTHSVLTPQVTFTPTAGTWHVAMASQKLVKAAT